MSLAVLNQAFRLFAPREQLGTLEWCVRHARNVDGRPFDHDAFPHLGAPGGPCDALDDPGVRRVWLQFASRLGKTFLGQCATMRKADCRPGPMMFASSVEKTAQEVVERTYLMIEASPRVAGQLRPKNRRRQDVIDFAACQCFLAWSRSSSTLADKEVEFGHANEIDKWEQLKTSREADPLKLFLDRFKNRPHHKILLESTPSVRGKSRVEHGRLESTNCKLFVPCPHCGRYQPLSLDGVVWDAAPGGTQDKETARRSAAYVCEHCEKECEDHHRSAMMRRGVWVPEGCGVNDDEARRAADLVAATVAAIDSDRSSGERYEWRGWDRATWIHGAPSAKIDAGYQLSSIYALSLGWGDVAAEFVSCEKKPQDLRNFVNSWLAETWEAVQRDTTWEQLGAAIIDDKTPRGVVPTWASIVVAAIDRQKHDRFPWIVEAWGPQDRHATIDYGESHSFEQLKKLLARSYPHADGGAPVQTCFALFDSGFIPEGVGEWCRDRLRDGFNVLPCKGSSTALDSDYRVNRLGKNTKMPGMQQVLVDTTRTQAWIEGLFARPRGVYGLFRGSLHEHQDFLEQLLNDAPVDELDGRNNDRIVYKRINSGKPNDFRDSKRYAYVARLLAVRGGPVPPRPPRGNVAESVEEEGPSRIRKLRIRR